MVQHGAIWCKIVQDSARYAEHAEQLTADGAYHCPLGSIMPFLTVKDGIYGSGGHDDYGVGDLFGTFGVMMMMMAMKSMALIMMVIMVRGSQKVEDGDGALPRWPGLVSSQARPESRHTNSAACAAVTSWNEHLR